MIERDRVIERLRSVFPDGFLCRADLNSKMIGAAYHGALYSLAKNSGLNSYQWLIQNGFRVIEKDMLPVETKIDNHSAASLVDYVFTKYPLAGQYCLSPEEQDHLFSSADIVFRRISGGLGLSSSDEAVLTLATIERLKEWSPENALVMTDDNEQSDDSGKGTFWNYIFQQYGFNPEVSDLSAQSIYKSFCSAVKNTLQRYRRFLAPKNTQRYYTSLLLHALAPTQSIENLLDILFHFYIDNLDYQYIENDISYQTLVKGMQARWSERDSEVKLRSTAVMSGLKTLFLERPDYMADLCDRLVRKIDALIRGDGITQDDRWDKLLCGWYTKKSKAERSELLGQKREKRVEFIATSTERIRVQYLMDEGQIGLLVPRIRLSFVAENRPVIRIFQGETEVYRSELSVAGNDLTLTTRHCFVPLQETALDFSEKLRLRAEIEYNGERLYSSEKKLFREYLVFDENGNERSEPSDSIYLFTIEGQSVTFPEGADVFMPSHPGALYHIGLAHTGVITVDGVEVYADPHYKRKVRIYPSRSPIPGIAVIREGQRYSLFDGEFGLTVHIPEDDNPLQYQLTVDGIRCINAQRIENHTYHFQVDTAPDVEHTAKVVDIERGVVVADFGYILRRGFRYRLDKPWYLETEGRAELSICCDSAESHLEAFRVPGSGCAEAGDSSGDFDYEVELPTVSCSFGDTSAFLLPQEMWYGDIEKTTFMKVSVPSGWQGKVILREREIRENSSGEVEIGNYLHSLSETNPQEPLWLWLRASDGRSERIELTQVVFSPLFTADPILVRGESLYWEASKLFFGSRDSTFLVEIMGKKNLSFEIGLSDRQISPAGALPHGRYEYQVFQIKRQLFSGEMKLPLRRSRFYVGDEEEFRYEGIELRLTDAIYWNDGIKKQEMRGGAGILVGLQYAGKTDPPSWEDGKLPHYIARLQFETRDGRRIYFNANPNNTDFECTNPVELWIVNDSRLILKPAEEMTVNFDTQRAEIVNQKLRLSNRELYRRVKNPDFFDYAEGRSQNVRSDPFR